MVKVFVSGCFDIVHGGHLEFFTQAKSLGDYLIVSFAGDNSLRIHKNKKSALPIEHKRKLLESINTIDKVMVSEDEVEGLDFQTNFLLESPHILAVTEDDKYGELKQQLCDMIGCKYVVLPKSLEYEKISTSDIINYIKSPNEVPLRVDFCGAWLDTPKYSRPDGYIVNCTVSPMVSLNNWQYNIGGGMGGSGAYSILLGKNGVQSELEDNKVGWQDPACILETGLCVWKSGELPTLEFKTNPDWLNGKMALLWTGKSHKTNELADLPRRYDDIVQWSNIARKSVMPDQLDLYGLAVAVHGYYDVQLDEGMDKLPTYNEIAHKYLGSGHGGYALYLFDNEDKRELFLKNENTMAIEPYIRGY
jgi:cytidyltransferase-like protein